MEKAAAGEELPEYYRNVTMKYVSPSYWIARMGEMIQMRRDELEEARRMLETETNPEALGEYEMRLGVLPVKIERMEKRMRELSGLGERKIAKLALFSLGSGRGEVLDYFEIGTPVIFMQYGVMQEALATYGR